jgi:hypothetical protein
MTIFYDRDTVRITQLWLSIGCHRYPIGELENLRKARGPADRITRRAICTALLSAPVLLVAGPRTSPLVALAMIGLLVAAPAAVAAVRTRLRPAAYLLWADYRGFPVLLYQTTDQLEFGKISRALTRARAVEVVE